MARQRPVRIRIQLTPARREPEPVSPYEDRLERPLTPHPAPGAAVVIDVLRATTTLAQAFAAGAREALFFAEPEAAAAAMARVARPFLLCGEREGLRIPGFDLGNSPREYAPERVRGAALLFASTNGSLAFLSTWDVPVQWAVAFVNLEAGVLAAADHLLRQASGPVPGATAEGPGADLVVVCAGKLGEPAREDTACAGLFALRLMRRLAEADRDVEVAADGGALGLAPDTPEETLELVARSEHGRYLASLGPEFAEDVAACARWDVLDTVPRGRAARLTS